MTKNYTCIISFNNVTTSLIKHPHFQILFKKHFPYAFSSMHELLWRKTCRKSTCVCERTWNYSAFPMSFPIAFQLLFFHPVSAFFGLIWAILNFLCPHLIFFTFLHCYRYRQTNGRTPRHIFHSDWKCAKKMFKGNFIEGLK